MKKQDLEIIIEDSGEKEDFTQFIKEVFEFVSEEKKDEKRLYKNS